jgi:soluble lytic murein transglycosylase-like protein
MTAVVGSLILSLLPVKHGPNCKHAKMARRLAPIIVAEAAAYDLDPRLVTMVISHESDFRARMVGAAGEIGLMQVKPDGHAAWLCSKWEVRHLRNPKLNVRCGVKILAYMRTRCGDPAERWLTAYNGGRCRDGAYGRKVLALARSFAPAVVKPQT